VRLAVRLEVLTVILITGVVLAFTFIYYGQH
jgi:hypothetical protein